MTRVEPGGRLWSSKMAKNQTSHYAVLTNVSFCVLSSPGVGVPMVARGKPSPQDRGLAINKFVFFICNWLNQVIRLRHGRFQNSAPKWNCKETLCLETCNCVDTFIKQVFCHHGNHDCSRTRLIAPCLLALYAWSLRGQNPQGFHLINLCMVTLNGSVDQLKMRSAAHLLQWGAREFWVFLPEGDASNGACTGWPT